jgi:uncharacterized protein YbjT (DUF2867 family)
MSDHTVTVFGGTGFLGRRVVRHLRSHGFTVRAASRHPARSRTLFVDEANIEAFRADIRDPPSMTSALDGAWAAVNAVSLYVEHGNDTFQALHVDAARNLAQRARQAGVQRLVQVSGIGADPASPSLYVSKRAEGEQAVRSVFPDAVIVRPAVMFGPDDAFLNTVLDLLRRLPVYPMFGRGETKLQPAFVEDVAEAIARILQREEPKSAVYELGGPRIYTYEEFLQAVASEAGLTPRLIPFPLAAWHALAGLAEVLPHPPVTRNQVELMEIDTVTSLQMPGFKDLDIVPQPVEDIVRRMLRVRQQE